MINDTYLSMNISTVSEITNILNELTAINKNIESFKNEVIMKLDKQDAKIKVIHKLFNSLNIKYRLNSGLGQSFKDIGLNNLLTTILIRLHTLETPDPLPGTQIT